MSNYATAVISTGRNLSEGYGSPSNIVLTGTGYSKTIAYASRVTVDDLPPNTEIMVSYPGSYTWNVISSLPALPFTTGNAGTTIDVNITIQATAQSPK